MMPLKINPDAPNSAEAVRRAILDAQRLEPEDEQKNGNATEDNSHEATLRRIVQVLGLRSRSAPPHPRAREYHGGSYTIVSDRPRSAR
jgi:hypothetical protein